MARAAHAHVHRRHTPYTRAATAMDVEASALAAAEAAKQSGNAQFALGHYLPAVVCYTDGVLPLQALASAAGQLGLPSVVWPRTASNVQCAAEAFVAATIHRPTWYTTSTTNCELVFRFTEGWKYSSGK